jgi:hypothetical protein
MGSNCCAQNNATGEPFTVEYSATPSTVQLQPQTKLLPVLLPNAKLIGLLDLTNPAVDKLPVLRLPFVYDIPPFMICLSDYMVLFIGGYASNFKRAEVFNMNIVYEDLSDL